MTSHAASIATALAAALAAFLSAATAFANGLGPYRLGMKAPEVQAVKACTPYKPVPSTGGLECPAFELAGKKRNISFIFDPATGGSLRKIQVWFYEGTDGAAAEAALVELISYLESEYGALESNALPAGAPVTAKALRAVVERPPATPGATKAQLKPAKNPADKFVFASLIKAPTGSYYVFLYVQPPR